MRLGCHWIAEVSPETSSVLNDRSRVLRFLESLPNRLGLNAVQSPTVQQGEDGSVRGIVLLSESHASAHTDLTLGMVFVDVFSCAPFSQASAREMLLEMWPGELLLDRFIERGGA